jgi:hypothetical protein
MTAPAAPPPLQDFFKYVDPSPVLEQDILKHVQLQLDLSPVFDQLTSEFGKISSHLAAINDSVQTVINALKPVSVDNDILDLMRNVGNLCEACGETIHSQTMNISAFKTLHLPVLEKSRTEFARFNAECQGKYDEWGQILPKTKPEIVTSHETALQSAMSQRAALFYNLHQRLIASQDSSNAAIVYTMATLCIVFSEHFLPFFQNNAALIKEIQDRRPSKQDIFKELTLTTSANHSENVAYLDAQHFWAIRRRHVTVTDEIPRPSGIVWVHGRKMMAKWVRRFVIFNQGVLHLHDPITGQCDATYPLALVTVGPVQKKRRRFTFKIQGPQETLIFAALTQWDVSEWIMVLTTHNENIIMGGDAASSSNAVANPAGRCCADCGASDASWCSLNWCTALCLKCSGVHRQMSSTTSKVRSVQLDHLHSYIQDMLCIVSNTAANDLLMTTPCDFDVGPRTEEPIRMDFITRKYQKMQWATKTPPPDPFKAIEDLDFLGLFHAMNFGRGDDRFETMAPIHAAVQSGDPIMIAIAVCCTLDIDVVDGNGWTSLCYAVYYGNNEAAKFLLSMGAKREKAKIDLSTLTIYNGDKDLIDQLVTFTGTMSSTFKPACTKFAKGKNALMTELLIPLGTRKLCKVYRETAALV